MTSKKKPRLASGEKKYVHVLVDTSREYSQHYDYPADPETMSFELALRLAEKSYRRGRLAHRGYPPVLRQRAAPTWPACQ